MVSIGEHQGYNAETSRFESAKLPALRRHNRMKCMGKRPMPNCRSSLLCFACMIILIACTSPQEEHESNMTRGNSLVSAIEAYEQQYGQPPTTLHALVPEFLPVIPLTVFGKEFEYEPNDRFSYNRWSLTFHVESNNTGCTYISYFGRWDCWPPNAGKE